MNLIEIGIELIKIDEKITSSKELHWGYPVKEETSERLLELSHELSLKAAELTGQ